MMNKLRQHTKVVLWIVTVAFIGTIIFAWGAGGMKTGPDPNILGVVNGVEIYRQRYDALFRQQYDQAIKESAEGEITEDRLTKLHETVWSRIVSEVLMGMQVEELEIEVSDAELVEFMRVSPLPEIQGEEAFQTDGKFDYNKYINLMNDPETNWLPIESYVRNQLVFAKLQKTILNSVYVVEDDVRDEFDNNNTKASVEYVYFRPTSEPDLTRASDDELKAYFAEHEEEFAFARQEDRVGFALASFLPLVDPQVEDSVVNLLGSIRERILAGEDFGDLASEYSHDNPTQRGDLSWTRKGGFVPEFEEPLLALEEGGITEPFRSRFGYHIARFEELRESEDGSGNPYTEMKSSHILIRVEPAEVGQTEFEQKLRDLEGISNLSEFKRKASELGAQLSDTEPLSLNDRIHELVTDSKRCIEWGLESKVGAVSELFKTNSGHVVVCVTERLDARMPDFVELRDAIAAKFESKRAVDELELKAGEFVGSVGENSANFKTTARKYGLEVKEQLDFVRGKFLGSEIQDQQKFKAVAFGLTEEKPVSEPLKGQTGVYVIHLLKPASFDQEMFSAQHDSIYQSLLSNKQNRMFQEWYSELAEGSEIEDFRTDSGGY